jgi:hypothetical protein
MAYGTGKYPTEAASKIAHMKLLQNPTISALITQFDAVDPGADPSAGECTGTVNMSEPHGITHVVSVDGGEVVVPNPVRREKAVGFVNVCTTMFSMATLDRLRNEPWMDPREYARILLDSQTLQPAILPLAGVALPNQTVRQSIRTLIDQTLEMSGLYPVLNFLVSRMWNDGYEMPGPGSPAMLCRSCRIEFSLPRNQRVFACPECRHGHTLSDYLGIAEDGSDDWGRADAVTQLRDVMETLSLFAVVRGLYGDPATLGRVLFIKDGPLLLRANLYKLADAIRELAAHLRSRETPVNIVGVDKHGEMVDFIPFVASKLPNPGDYFLPSVPYIVREIKGGEFPSDPRQYRNRVSFAAKLIARVGPDHLLALSIPTGEFMLAPAAGDLLGFERIIRALGRLVSYRYENALMPIVATNSAASLSFNPSGRILEHFVDEMLGRRSL